MQGRSSSGYLVSFLKSCIDHKAYLSGKILHAHAIRVGVLSDSFLANHLVEFYSKCDQVGRARLVFDKMPHKNIFSWHAMLGCYCKKNELEKAHDLFVQMPERNSVSWNTIISAFARNGLERKALDFYCNMRRCGFEPTRFTLASVLSVCGELGETMCGKECHGVAVKLGLDKNEYVGNASLAMYAKSGCISDAVMAFQDLIEPNEVSFTALMGGLVAAEQIEEAFKMFMLMHRNGISIDSVSLSSVLGVCAKGRSGSCEAVSEGDWAMRLITGKQIHGFVLKLGFDGLQLSNSLLDMYAKNGDMDSASMVFSSLSEVSIVSWNIMIGGYGQSNENMRAMHCMEQMQIHGFEPDDVTYINMLVSCVKSSDVETAQRIFDRMVNPSLSSWNAMLSGYSHSGCHNEAVGLFREMQFENIQADRTTLAILLGSCSALGYLDGGRQIHSFLLKSVYRKDVFVASGLIGTYMKCGKTEVAEHIFQNADLMDDPVCWNSMMAGLSYNAMDGEAFSLFAQMLREGILPTEFSYTTILSCCAKLCLPIQGSQVHCLILKDGFTSDVVVGSVLVDVYSKCGSVHDARQIFDLMPCKNIVTWNEMLQGYAQNGDGDESVCLYEQMIRSGFKPDHVTFVSVLTACSHAGLVNLGFSIFNSMKDEHGVEPLPDHYTCIIDLLGRAGRFSELEVLIEKMPYKNDRIVWEALLSSCRVHSNVSLARRAAEELLRLNQKSASPYVLLANMYSSLGRWDEASGVRNMMTEKEIIKDPGYSWLDLGKRDVSLQV